MPGCLLDIHHQRVYVNAMMVSSRKQVAYGPHIAEVMLFTMIISLTRGWPIGLGARGIHD